MAVSGFELSNQGHLLPLGQAASALSNIPLQNRRGTGIPLLRVGESGESSSRAFERSEQHVRVVVSPGDGVHVVRKLASAACLGPSVARFYGGAGVARLNPWKQFAAHAHTLERQPHPGLAVPG